MFHENVAWESGEGRLKNRRDTKSEKVEWESEGRKGVKVDRESWARKLT